MGQGKPIKSAQVQQNLGNKKQQLATSQQLNQYIKTIFDDTMTKFIRIQPVVQAIKKILINFHINLPATKLNQGFLINEHMLKIFYHKRFLLTMSKLTNLLIQKLQDIMTRLAFRIKRHQYRYCLYIANFIIFFTDNKLLKMIQTLPVRNDLHPETTKFMKQLQQNQIDSIQTNQNLINKFQLNQLQKIQKCLRISLNQLIDMKLQIQTRSNQTLSVINKLQNSCFLLYMKTLLSSQHSKILVTKAKNQFFKINVKIGQYFIGKGANQNLASLYQPGVVFLYLILQKNDKTSKQLKSLPSHLFTTLPIVTYNTCYDFIINICLHTLTYIKNGDTIYSRLSFNRLMTFKLIDLIIKRIKITSSQITYYLQNICLQTKIGQIQRSYVIDLVQNYCNLVNQVILYNSELKQKNNKQKKQKKAQLKNIYQFCHEFKRSQILMSYLQNCKENYKIKYSNKNFNITPFDIITQLQNDQNIIESEFRIICQKFLYEIILQKRVIYQYSDRQIWNQILPNILGDRDMSQNGSDEGVTQIDQIQFQQRQMQRTKNSSTIITNQINVKTHNAINNINYFIQKQSQPIIINQRNKVILNNIEINFDGQQNEEDQQNFAEKPNQKSQYVSVVNIQENENESNQIQEKVQLPQSQDQNISQNEQIDNQINHQNSIKNKGQQKNQQNQIPQSNVQQNIQNQQQQTQTNNQNQIQ